MAKNADHAQDEIVIESGNLDAQLSDLEDEKSKE